MLSAILEKLPATEERRDFKQLVRLLGVYFCRGEERAWEPLTRLALADDETAQDVLASTGERGLKWVAEHILPTLDAESQWRIGMWLPDEEAEDQTPTQKELRLRLAENETKREARPVQKEATYAPKEFLSALGTEQHLPWASINRFVKEADEEQFCEAAEVFLRATDRQTMKALMSVFKERTFPLAIDKLFELADDDRRGFYFRRVLGRIESQAIREFGLNRLKNRPVPHGTLSILRKSFLPGDEATIWAYLPETLMVDEDLRHDVVLSLLSLMDQFPTVNWQPFAEWIYEHSPCAYCRGSSVDRMRQHGAVPETVAAEAPFDAEPDIRNP